MFSGLACCTRLTGSIWFIWSVCLAVVWSSFCSRIASLTRWSSIVCFV